MDGRWLYGGGCGTRVTPRHLCGLLAAALTPEELRDKDDAAAARMRAAQAMLLDGLVAGRQAPEQQQQQQEQQQEEAAGGAGLEGDVGGGQADAAVAEQPDVLYSVLMRWGLLCEVRFVLWLVWLVH